MQTYLLIEIKKKQKAMFFQEKSDSVKRHAITESQLIEYYRNKLKKECATNA